MGIGGHEALLVAQVLGLALTMVPAIRKTLLNERQGIASVGPRSRSVDAVLHVLSLSGLTVWWIQDPLVRLLATAVGAVGFAIQTALEWGRAWETDDLQRTSTGECLCLSQRSAPFAKLTSSQPGSSDCCCRAWQSTRTTATTRSGPSYTPATEATTSSASCSQSLPQQSGSAGRSSRLRLGAPRGEPSLGLRHSRPLLAWVHSSTPCIRS
jgi:hypothetical protein